MIHNVNVQVINLEEKSRQLCRACISKTQHNKISTAPKSVLGILSPQSNVGIYSIGYTLVACEKRHGNRKERMHPCCLTSTLRSIESADRSLGRQKNEYAEKSKSAEWHYRLRRDLSGFHKLTSFPMLLTLLRTIFF